MDVTIETNADYIGHWMVIKVPLERQTVIESCVLVLTRAPIGPCAAVRLHLHD